MKRCIGFLAGDLALVLVAWAACSWGISKAIAERVYPEPAPAFGVEDYAWIVVRDNFARFSTIRAPAGVVISVQLDAATKNIKVGNVHGVGGRVFMDHGTITTRW